MATPSGGSVGATGNPLIDGLLQGNSWTFQAGPRVITYSLNTTGYGGSWSAEMAAAVDTSFDAWEAVANISFQRVVSGTYAWQSTANIALGLTGSQQMQEWGTIGYAFFPTSDGNNINRADLGDLLNRSFTASSYARPEGDIFLDNYDAAYDYLDPGGFGISVILHEIGHALGLKHPHDSGGAAFPTFSELGIGDLDLDQYTVMSYDVAFPNYYDGNPETPMVLDILAIQYIYGANMTYHTGNDVYQFVGGRVYAIWDAGGNDTIDASQSNGVTLKLEAGTTNIDEDSYSTVGIAYGVTIENAIGSKFQDSIWGNGADNTIWGGQGVDELRGGAGNDVLYGDDADPLSPQFDDHLDGGVGADTLVGGKGNDTYEIEDVQDKIVELADGGWDEVRSSVTFSLTSTNVEALILTGNAAINASGDDGDNIIVGNLGNNTLTGGKGDDTISDINNLDVDTFSGGEGNDTYIVGALTEQVLELAAEGTDTVRTSLQQYALQDHFENLELLGDHSVFEWKGIGNAVDNVIKGTRFNDVLDGAGGNDTLKGGEGEDVYYVDSSGDRVVGELGYEIPQVDEVRFSVSLDAQSFTNVEVFTFLGGANISLHANDSDNIIFGNSGANVIDGAGGDDKIHLGHEDVVTGGDGKDSFDFGQLATNGDVAASIFDLTYLETVSWSTNLPLAGAATQIEWPMGSGTGESTLLHQLEYFSDGASTILSFGLDDVAGADFSLTLGHAINKNDLWVVAQGSTIKITNTDLPPSSIFLSKSEISEDAAIGTVVGTLSSDGNASMPTFSLLDDADGLFAIDGTKLVVDDALDHETAASHTITVRVTEKSGNAYDKDLTIELADINDNAPTITSYGGEAIVSKSMLEYVNGAVVGVMATDPDTKANVIYSIVGGADKTLFTIDAVDGSLSFVATPDFENPTDANKDNIYIVETAASDGTFSDTQTFVFKVSDVPPRTLIGTAGRDLFFGGDPSNPNVVTDEDDSVYGLGGDDHLVTNGGNDLLDGGTGNDDLSGRAGDDVYVVDSIGDMIQGEEYFDGNDTVKSSISWALGTALENLVLTGIAINGTGNALANFISGNDSGNLLDGKGGADTMSGGKGNDTYIADDLGDRIVESIAGSPGGIDMVKSSVSHKLDANVENLTLTDAGHANATGNELKNILLGNDGNNRLDGAAGNDTMAGAKGNDTYVVDAVGDVVNETIAAGGGTDMIESAFTYSLAAKANIENLMLTGAAANATGNALGNVLTGNNLANILDGGTGKDTMRGGGGNDLYLVDNAGDVVEELGSDSADEVKSAVVRFTAIAGVEHYTYSGATAWSFVGTSAANKVSSGADADKLDGASGNDTLLGNAGNDLLVGGIGDDWLDGGLGNDTMKGGAGKDTYVVNAAGDKIDEEGNTDIGDLVRSSVAINLTTLGAGLIEDAVLLGATAINATGNTSINHLTGNDGANVLDGKSGADILEGGKGADTYVVDQLGDQVIESLAGALGGIDLVKGSVTYTLGANLEKLTLTETESIDGFGNTLNNTLLGNIGANRLDGGTGNDTMTGGKGNDVYVVDTTGDVVSETIAAGGGIDTVESLVTFTLATRVNVENLELKGLGNISGTGNALANLIEGNDGNNKIDGGSGNDVLFGNGGIDTIQGGLGNDTIVGGLGADQLNGGSGRDAFDFDALLEAGDTITGFVKGAAGDVLDLRDLLGTIGLDPFADQVLSFNQSGANTIVRIDADGAGVGSATDLVTILNVSLTTADTNNFLV
jgi:Ca2+-binding RTX toxin-like protein